jgi:hypothetical protein
MIFREGAAVGIATRIGDSVLPASDVSHQALSLVMSAGELDDSQS